MYIFCSPGTGKSVLLNVASIFHLIKELTFLPVRKGAGQNDGSIFRLFNVHPTCYTDCAVHHHSTVNNSAQSAVSLYRLK